MTDYIMRIARFHSRLTDFFKSRPLFVIFNSILVLVGGKMSTIRINLKRKHLSSIVYGRRSGCIIIHKRKYCKDENVVLFILSTRHRIVWNLRYLPQTSSIFGIITLISHSQYLATCFITLVWTVFVLPNHGMLESIFN